MIKLSDAIRAGAVLRPQGFGRYFREVDGALHSCAIGAAYEYLFGEADSHGDPADNKVAEYLGLTEETKIPYPYGGGEEYIMYVITVLNDTARMSREEIADYIAHHGY